MPRRAESRHRLRALTAAALTAGALAALPAVASAPAKVKAQAPPAPAEAADEAPAGFLQALRDGAFHLALRYRFETVDDDAFRDGAEASTLRTALSYRTGDWRGWNLFLEAEDVSPVFDDDSYANAGLDGRDNGVRGVPVVADPEGTAMTQAYLRWRDGEAESVKATLGRQEINLGDERFVGAVGWRQHHQTFDAARLEWAPEGAPGRFHADAIWVAGVNRIFGDRQELDGHLLRLGVEPVAGLGLTAYGFRLDYDEPSPLSTLTLGVEAKGSRPLTGALELRYEAEWARQEDAGDNPVPVDTDYRLASLGLGVGRFGFDATWEVLGGPGDGQRAFATPLATLHKWNGWADVFLQTPAAGLETLYLRAKGPLGERLGWTVVYHDFASDEGGLDLGSDLGSEVDAELTFRASWGQTFALTAADYSAGDVLTDTRKVWFWTAYTF
ncbi:MAG TPA: alginate export family protein [Thermoanaerobaculia bacterium]